MPVWLFLLFFAEPFDSTFRAGVVALNNNDFAQAKTQLEAASKLQPHDPRVWLALAQTYWRLRKVPDAQAAAAKTETLSSEPALLHGLSLYYSETADYAKAAQLEARFAEFSPAAAPHAMELFLRAGLPKAAIEWGRKSLAGKSTPQMHNLLGKAYEAEGDPVSAAGEYQAAITGNPYDEGFHFDLAQILLKQQKFAAALEKLEASRKYFDKSAQLELASGVACYGLRRFPQAIDAFLRTIRLDGGIEQPYIFLGRMLDQAEDKLPAIAQAFALFAARAPDHYLSSFLYGKALALDNPGQAEALFRKSIAKDGQFWESHFEFGVLLDRQGRFEEAAREIRRSIELNPDHAPPHYRLARLYERLGKTADARAEREQYEKLSTKGPVPK